MDINLPGIGGLEVLRVLKQDRATAHIPVIAVSANALPADIETGLGSGFFRYLTKPIVIHELMGAIDLALAANVGHTAPRVNSI
jgi:CheY-like chemotaxis protein